MVFMVLWGVFALGVCCKYETWLFNQYNVFYRMDGGLESNLRLNGRFRVVLGVVRQWLVDVARLLLLEQVCSESPGTESKQ